jgi:hypothetical protein
MVVSDCFNSQRCPPVSLLPSNRFQTRPQYMSKRWFPKFKGLMGRNERVFQYLWSIRGRSIRIAKTRWTGLLKMPLNNNIG